MVQTETFYTQDVINELSDAVAKQMSNRLPKGLSRDYSKAQPSLGDFNITSPMVAALLEKLGDSSLGTFSKDQNGDWVITSYTWGTTDPDDGEGCCFVPFDIQACKDQAKVFSLCLKDCETTLDKMMNKELGYKGTDLLNYFQRLGWTYDQSLQFMAWFSFAYRTQRVIAQGLVDYQGPGLRPFHGVAEVMSHPAVTPLRGADILGGFAQAGCVIDVLTAGATANYAIFVHPLGHAAIDAVVTEGRNGKLPAGWERGNFGNFHGTPVTLKFKGIPVVKDYYVPKDLEVANTFEAYIIDLSTTRASMIYNDLMIPKEAIYTSQTIDPTDNCTFVTCDVYENAGVVHSSNYARNILISDMPLGAHCSAGIFTRVQNAMDATVPFPMATIPAE